MEKETSDTYSNQPEQPQKRGNLEALAKAREAKKAKAAAEVPPASPGGSEGALSEQPGFLLETYDDELASHGPWIRAEPARFVGSAVQMLFRHRRTGNHIVVSVDPGEPHGRHPVIVLREMLDEFTAAHGV